MYGQIEDYIVNLMFTVPMPERKVLSEIQIYLPKIGEGIQGKECEMISFRQPDLTSLPYVDI